MISTPLDFISVGSDRDLSRVRKAVGERADALSFGALERTRVVTAASELCRNVLTYGGGGSVRVEEVRRAPTGQSSGRIGLRLVFEDQGAGIEDVDLALSDGYTTGSGLGLGLGGAKRLVDEFEIETSTDEGTRISIVAWRQESR